MGLFVCDIEEQTEIQEILGPDFIPEIVPLRSWFLMYVGDPSWGDWVRYFLTREPWNDIGSTEVVVFRRLGSVQSDEDLVYWDDDGE